MFRPAHSASLLMPAITLLALAALSCGGLSVSGPANVLVGQWQRDDGQETIAFSKDGAVTIAILGATMEGEYKLLDDATLQMDIAILDETVSSVFAMNLLEDTLTLTAEDGASATYVHVR